MQRRTYLLLGIFLAFVSTGAIMKINQAPTKRSTAPGEQSCGGCHAGNINTGSGSVSLSLPVEYVPDSTYTFTHSLSDSGFPNPRHGFTTTSLDSLGNQAGSFTLLNSVKNSLQTDLVMGQAREYLGHRSADSTRNWTYEWTAPSGNVGDIYFYAVSVYANRNNAISGDRVYQDTFVLSLAASYPQPSFTTSISSLCLEDSVSISNASLGTITEYSWDFGDGANPPNSTDVIPPNVVYTTPGTKTISLTVSGPDGSESFSQDLFVSQVPQVDAGADVSVCEGDAVQLFGQLTGLDPDYELSWSGGGGFDDPMSLSPTVQGDSSVSLVLTASSLLGCGSSSDTLVLTVDEAPVPIITGTDTLLSSAAASYQWYYADSSGQTVTPLSEGNNQSLVAEGEVLTSVDNTGFLVVEVVYENGCSALSDPVVIEILTSLQNAFFQEVEVFPNPSTGLLIIRVPEGDVHALELSLLDAKANRVLPSKKLSPGREHYLNLAGLAAGIYFLQMKTDEKIGFRKVLIL